MLRKPAAAENPFPYNPLKKSVYCVAIFASLCAVGFTTAPRALDRAL